MDESKHEFAKPGDVIGNYRVCRFVGGGSLGEVYEVEHIKLGVRRALKALVAAARAVDSLRVQFLSESRVLARLDSPRVVRVHDLDIEPASGVPYFVMDFVVSPDGRPQTLVEACCTGLGEKALLDWFADICEGLDYIHSQGIVHGDVTMNNILVGPEGRAVLSDFGLSRLCNDTVGPGLADLVPVEDFITDSRLGTVMYRAPEVCRGAPSDALSPAADAWSLGVLIFRMLTGHWFDPSERELWLDLLVDYDCPWREALDRLLSPDPSMRIPGGGLAVLARQMSEGYIPLEILCARRDRRRRLAVAAAGAFAFLAAALFVALRPRVSVREAVPAVAAPAGIAPAHAAARLWDDRTAYDELDRRVVLAGAAALDPDVAAALYGSLERTKSFFGYRRALPEKTLARLDAWVDRQADQPESAANPAQLLLVAGEVRRQKMMRTPGAEFGDDAKRLADLACGFIAYVTSSGIDAEWAYETVLDDWTTQDLRVLRRLVDRLAQSGLRVDPWLSLMMQADLAIAEARLERRGRSLSQLAVDGDRLYGGRLSAARDALKMADALAPKRHATALRLLCASAGCPDEVRTYFAQCRCFRADDLRDWSQCAIGLLARWGAEKGAVEALLDAAFLEDGPEEGSWARAFYVIGRWRIFAAIGRGEEPWADADRRAWAYADESVRARTLMVMRAFICSPLFARAPEMRRLAIAANFAAVATVCGDDGLAGELTRLLPADFASFVVVVREAAGTDTDVFARLWRLRSGSLAKGGRG